MQTTDEKNPLGKINVRDFEIQQFFPPKKPACMMIVLGSNLEYLDYRGKKRPRYANSQNQCMLGQEYVPSIPFLKRKIKKEAPPSRNL